MPDSISAPAHITPQAINAMIRRISHFIRTEVEAGNVRIASVLMDLVGFRKEKVCFARREWT